MATKHKHVKVLIIGGGTGGITMAARLIDHLHQGHIAILEANEFHYYQPAWTLAAGGIYNLEDTKKPMADYIPEGVEWIKDFATQLNPKENSVSTQGGLKITYDYLILATGLVVDFDQIEGLSGNLNKNGICSMYSYEGAKITNEMLENLKSGHAVFTMPPVPIKCAGAPQKIMYLADALFREKNRRKNIKISWFSNSGAMFGIPTFAAPLKVVADRQGIETHFEMHLVKVEADKKIAHFQDNKNKKDIAVPYDLLHIVPPQRTHDFVAQSDLANKEGPQKGWMKVDQHTLQNPDFPNVFGIGDVTGVPNSKTGAAIRKQAPVVEKNLMQVMQGQAPTAKYDGYSSCPLVTSRNTVILAEFGYDSKLMPSFPLDPTKERYIYFLLKRYLLPILYWYGMLRGRA